MEKKHRNLSLEAVSPVIGVMLMLVVTIIIAAAISAYAGGMVSDQEETPTAQLDVQLKSEGTYPKLVFTHLGGDSLDTSELKIVTYFHEIIPRAIIGSGERTEVIHKHTTDGSLNPMEPGNYFDAADYETGNGSLISNNGYPCTISNGEPVKHWGNSTMMPGDIYTTIDQASLRSVITAGTVGDEPIEVEIIHIPSGKTIFSGEVIY